MLTKTTRAVTVLNANAVELLQGEAARVLLTKKSFLIGWDQLYNTCPWATVFQSQGFVLTWYKTYHEKYLPIVVTSFDGPRLTGLLTLARNEDGLITGAGENQSEYQVWLATDANGEDFIVKALLAVCYHFPENKVQIKYIPGNAPMSWIEASALKTRCLVKTYKQPLILIDAAHFANELRKKNRREKLNRLKRIGSLQFEKIADCSTFAAVLNELAFQYDFRKMAMYNRAFFITDPNRKVFLLSLFEQGLLHATVLKLNTEIIAANVSVTDNNWMHLQGINTHSSPFAKYSPGILHFLMLGQMLAKENITVFDLTPGADSYKDQLATDYTEAFQIDVSRNNNLLQDKIKFAILERSKILASGIGISQVRLTGLKWKAHLFKEKFRQVKKQKFSFFIKNIVSQLSLSKKSKSYVWKRDSCKPPIAVVAINKNCLSDLLCYEGRETWKSKWEFLHDAMQRLEMGETSYTLCEKGSLKACVWLAKGSSSFAANDLVLQAFYCHPDNYKGLAAFCSTVTTFVARDHPDNDVYAVPTQKDKILCQILEDVGFTIV